MKNKVFAVIFSLLLAFALWVYVITVVTPDWEDSFRDVPVMLQSEAVLADRGLIITEINNEEVALRLSGNRSDLAGLHSGNIRVVADVSKIYEPGVHNLTYTVSYPGNIATGAVSVQNKSPDTIQVVVEQLVSKEVDVFVDFGDTKVPAGYLCDEANMVVGAQKITISGPKSVVDQITQARIQIDLSRYTSPIAGLMPYTLCDREGTPVEDDLIAKSHEEGLSVYLRIVRIKSIPLEFTVIYGGGVTEKNVTITYSLNEIQISGGEKPLSTVNKLSFVIDVSEMVENQELKLPFELPAGITNETGIDAVTVKVEFKDVAVKTLRVENFEFINVPEGYSVKLIKKALDITLRGPASAVNAITAKDLKVVLDMSSVKPNEQKTVLASIEIGELFREVGAVGSYAVAVQITEN